LVSSTGTIGERRYQKGKQKTREKRIRLLRFNHHQTFGKTKKAHKLALKRREKAL